jgi:hypothetical protein
MYSRVATAKLYEELYTDYVTSKLILKHLVHPNESGYIMYTQNGANERTDFESSIITQMEISAGLFTHDSGSPKINLRNIY